MKKLLLLLMLTIPTVTRAEISKTTCENAGGEVIQINSVDYCKSSQTLTWWNAHSWCHSLGGDLIDFLEFCPDYPETHKCPEVARGLNIVVWTKTVPNSVEAYRAYFVTGDITALRRNFPQPALCR